MKTEKIYWRLIWLLALAGLFVMFYGPYYRICGDGFLRYQQLCLLLEEGHLTPQRFPLFGTMFAIPLYYLDHGLDACGWLLSRYNYLLFLLGLAGLIMVFRKRVSVRALLFFVILLTGGSLFGDADRFFTAKRSPPCWSASGWHGSPSTDGKPAGCWRRPES